MVILSTAPDEKTAIRLGRDLVKRRLAACVNVIPGLRSIYRWKGAIHDDAEVLMVIKTRAGVSARAIARLKAQHPYEVPEAVVLDVQGGYGPYLEWVEKNTI